MTFMHENGFKDHLSVKSTAPPRPHLGNAIQKPVRVENEKLYIFAHDPILVVLALAHHRNIAHGFNTGSKFWEKIGGEPPSRSDKRTQVSTLSYLRQTYALFQNTTYKLTKFTSTTFTAGP